MTVNKVGYLKRSFTTKYGSEPHDEQIETRKNPPLFERWVNRLFVLKDEALICYEETSPHRIEDNIIGTTIIPIKGSYFEK